MNQLIWFYFIYICYFPKYAFSVYVSDLNPDINCNIALNRGDIEREDDPFVVRIRFLFNYIQFDLKINFVLDI